MDRVEQPYQRVQNDVYAIRDSLADQDIDVLPGAEPRSLRGDHHFVAAALVVEEDETLAYPLPQSEMWAKAKTYDLVYNGDPIMMEAESGAWIPSEFRCFGSK